MMNSSTNDEIRVLRNFHSAVEMGPELGPLVYLISTALWKSNTLKERMNEQLNNSDSDIENVVNNNVSNDNMDEVFTEESDDLIESNTISKETKKKVYDFIVTGREGGVPALAKYITESQELREVYINNTGEFRQFVLGPAYLREELSFQSHEEGQPMINKSAYWIAYSVIKPKKNEVGTNFFTVVFPEKCGNDSENPNYKRFKLLYINTTIL